MFHVKPDADLSRGLTLPTFVVAAGTYIRKRDVPRGTLRKIAHVEAGESLSKSLEARLTDFRNSIDICFITVLL